MLDDSEWGALAAIKKGQGSSDAAALKRLDELGFARQLIHGWTITGLGSSALVRHRLGLPVERFEPEEVAPAVDEEEIDEDQPE